MIGQLNHVAIAVPDLKAASANYRDTLGAKVSEPIDLPLHGVTTIFVELENAKLELLHPLGEESPIAKFLERNPDGGLHHICFDVPDLIASRDQLLATGARILGSPDPEIGAHGKPVLFIHPKDLTGSLIELQQA